MSVGADAISAGNNGISSDNDSAELPSIALRITPCRIGGDESRIYFEFDRYLKNNVLFQELLAIFRDHKMIFDSSSRPKMWYTQASQVTNEFAPTLRHKLRKIGIHLRPFPGDVHDEVETVELAIEATQTRSSRTVVIDKRDKAYLIVCRRGHPIERIGGVFCVDGRVRQIIRNDLSGVTDCIDHTYDLGDAGKLLVETHQTYDVWLCAEFVELVSKVVPEANLFISETAQTSIDSRWERKDLRRRPIPEVEAVRHPEIPLHPHQFEGVRFFMENNGRGLLGDSMGLGKTMTTLAYVAGMQKRALVVAPKRVLDHWISEATAAFPGYFLGQTAKLGAHIKKSDGEEQLRSVLTDANLVCVNYETLERFLPLVKDAGLDTIILDESHYIKNPTAKRTKLLLDSSDSFEHRLLLSGTPIKNRVEEFPTQLEFLGYAGAHEIVDMPPGRVWNTLMEKKIYLRRSISVELPHLSFKDPEIVDARDAPEELGEFEHGFEIKELDSSGRQEISTMVREKLAATALFKAPTTATLCINLLHQFADDRIIVFTERVACANMLFRSLEKQGPDIGALLHHGRFSDSDRESVLEEFQDPTSNKRVLVSTRQSLAVGVNLQCANRVIFNDLPWTPADMLQAAARVKRLNQRKEVSEYWIVADTAFDENLLEILQQKRRLIQMYGEGKNVSEEDEKWMNERVSYLEIIYGIGYRKDEEQR